MGNYCCKSDDADPPSMETNTERKPLLEDDLTEKEGYQQSIEPKQSREGEGEGVQTVPPLKPDPKKRGSYKRESRSKSTPAVPHKISSRRLLGRGASQKYLSHPSGLRRDPSFSASLSESDDAFFLGNDYLASTRLDVHPFVGQHIINNSRFTDKREDLEQIAVDIEGIISVEFQEDSWQVVAEQPRAIRKCKKLFDIVAWIVPVIPSWRGNQDIQHIDVPHGVWYWDDILGFISDFGLEPHMKEELDRIDDSSDNYDYLADRDFPKNSPFFEEFVDKLRNIRMAQTVEIVIVGTKTDVCRLIRKIREAEIDDPAMKQFEKKKAKPKKEFVRAPTDQDTIPSNLIRVHNCPTMDSTELAKFFSRFGDILEVHVFQTKETGVTFVELNFATPDGRAALLRECKIGNLQWDGAKIEVSDAKRRRERKFRRRRTSSKRRIF